MVTALWAALTGALTAWLGFAPVGWWWFPYFGFAALAALITRAPTVRRGALHGFAFGLAYFIAGGRLPYSLHPKGYIPWKSHFHRRAFRNCRS